MSLKPVRCGLTFLPSRLKRPGGRQKQLDGLVIQRDEQRKIVLLVEHHGDLVPTRKPPIARPPECRYCCDRVLSASELTRHEQACGLNVWRDSTADQNALAAAENEAEFASYFTLLMLTQNEPGHPKKVYLLAREAARCWRVVEQLVAIVPFGEIPRQHRHRFRPRTSPPQ